MAINIHKIITDALLDLCKEKKLESITIKDLIDSTGISRQAFYNRFQDKADLIQYTYEHTVLNEFHKAGAAGTYYENTMNYCRALEKYRFFMKQAYKLEGQNNLKDYIFSYAVEYDKEWHRQHFKNQEFPKDFEFISYYHSVASIYIEMDWICSNSKDRKTPEEVAALITNARKISLSDKYFGEDNPIYEI